MVRIMWLATVGLVVAALFAMSAPVAGAMAVGALTPCLLHTSRCV